MGEKRILIVANRNQLCRLHNLISAAINHEDRQSMTFKAEAGWPEIVVTKHDSPEASISVGVTPRTEEESSAPGRCKVCGWPLVTDWRNGCTEDNCSMRPAPRTNAC